MSHRSLGEICIELGLLDAEQVERVMRADLDTRLFGERARRLGLLDDEGVARALAHQARINLVPGDRLARLQVPPDMVTLLPASLVRDRLLLPTFLDPETRVLSMLVADPLDHVALRAAQAAAGAARVRAFVVARSRLVELIDRVLPNTGAPPVPTEAAAESTTAEHARVVVFEPDPARARALRLLAEAEAAPVEVVTDAALVGPFIEAGEATLVVYRKAVEPTVRGLVGGWLRQRAGLTVRVVEDHAPHARAPLAWEDMRNCLEGIAREHGRESSGDTREDFLALLDALVERHGPPPRSYALLRELVAGAVARGADDAVLLEDAAAFADRLALPWDAGAVTRAVGARIRGDAGPGDDGMAEACFTAIAAWRAGLRAHRDATGADEDARIAAIVGRLGDGAARHDAGMLRALAGVARPA